ncbi:hypothetical protein BRE01_39170 [Brevibacillus reuszeri]|uniref:Uncharacterized protein n=1 Tax=Brevibacillus reuszeri TaxID=54915 RepID=A0A0K9YVL3_9BACL|nr:hypothetical protein [Brevibacillus reuszeri]KNB72749.1 hypothetical protein ADS79_12970 [Brevibacillus reuszeri]MED1860546.1 hypothetical protein [Brevibacillus reuszeri]GED70215.1 hypothetical protein BRE01_39170 [Brevibacillus reuszeri]
MLGTIWINLGLGVLAFIVTLAAAGAGNVWLVSFVRAGIAFAVFFLAAFPIRWVLAIITHTTASPVGEAGEAASGEPVAPLENPQQDSNREDPEESFSPLSLSKMEKIQPIEDPTTVAEVVRRLSDE